MKDKACLVAAAVRHTVAFGLRLSLGWKTLDYALRVGEEGGKREGRERKI